MIKATGIVRRIDDLGRVVIPKEIRRTQCIRQGDPLEIFTNGEGEVIFKKYSSLGAFFDVAGRYAEVLCKELGTSVMVCDRDSILAAAGAGRRELLERRVGVPLERLMEQRSDYCYAAKSDEYLYPCEGATRFLRVASPVLAAGDVVGLVALLSDDKHTNASEAEEKAVRIAAAFFAKQLEE